MELSDSGAGCDLTSGSLSEGGEVVIASDQSSASEHCLSPGDRSASDGHLSSGSSSAEVEPAVAHVRTGASASGWQVGSDCGSWVGKGRPLVPQAQVLVMNVYMNLRRLPGAVCRSLLCQMGRGAVCRNYADWCAATLLGMSRNMVRDLWEAFSSNGWQVRGAGQSEALAMAPGVFAGASCPGAPGVSAQHALTVRVREAVHTAASGGTAPDYTRAMQRLQLAGVSVGSKYNHHSFLALTEHAAAICCRHLTAIALSETCPGLGILSDLSLVWDGVSIGGAMWSRGETLCVLGVGYCDCVGRIQYRLLDTPSENLQKAGPKQVELVLKSLGSHPAQLRPAALRRRCAIVGGDGALCGGGSEARHPSTRSCEQLWEAAMGGEAALTPCVEWDLFHRLDAAISDTIRNHAAATEVLEVGRSLGALFATGDGRALFRGTQVSLGTSTRVLPDQGGTRKITALANSIEYVIANLPAIHGALHARLGMARAGAGAQTQFSLVQLGRRVSAMNFVLFSLALSDVVIGHLVPLAMASQASDIGALSIWRRADASRRSLREAGGGLDQLQVWWSVTALVSALVTLEDLRRLWIALRVSKLGREFPRLTGATYDALFHQTYGRCKLHIDQAPEEIAPGMYTLHPRCQCASMQQRRGTGRRQEVTLPGGRRIRVPEWVSHSALPLGTADVRAHRGPADVLPRWLRHVPVAPPALQGESRFAKAPAPCRCVVPPNLPNRLLAFRQASGSCRLFIEAVADSVDTFLGARGANDTMLALGSAAAEALDWKHLVRKAPSKEQYYAFFRLAELLRPILSRTLWPPQNSFPHVRHVWPAVRGRNGWFQQFQLLALRIRSAAQDRSGAWGCWWRTSHFCVLPVLHTCVEVAMGKWLLSMGGGVFALPSAMGRGVFAHPSAIAMVCQNIAEFAHGIVGTAFRVSPEAVASLGCGMRLPGARGKKSLYRFRGRIGSLASLAAPRHLQGKVVRVVGVGVELDENALEASLSASTYFSGATPEGTYSWHAARLVHRVRMLRAVESCCERWGSIVHQLWTGNVIWHPNRIAARVLMRDAGLGEHGPQREIVVSEIARWMAEFRRMDPFVNRPAKLPRTLTLADRAAAQGLESLPSALRRALRESGYTVDDAKSATQNSTLPPAAQDALERAVRLGTRGILQPLPLFSEDKRVAAQSRAASVRKDALHLWLDSEGGMAWRNERLAIFGHGIDTPVLAEDAESPKRSRREAQSR